MYKYVPILYKKSICMLYSNNEDITDTAKNIPELAKLGTEYLKAILEDKVNAASRNS